jgi:hypothetical protein
MKKSGTGYTPIVRKIMFELPGVTEDICHGTTAFYVSKKLLSRMKEDGKTLVVYTPDRDEWTEKDDTTFYITDHYRNYPYVLVDLPRVKKPMLVSILTEAWKSRAGKKLLQQLGK